MQRCEASSGDSVVVVFFSSTFTGATVPRVASRGLDVASCTVEWTGASGAVFVGGGVKEADGEELGLELEGLLLPVAADSVAGEGEGGCVAASVVEESEMDEGDEEGAVCGGSAVSGGAMEGGPMDVVVSEPTS